MANASTGNKDSNRAGTPTILEQRQAELVEFYQSLGDEMNRYSYLISASTLLAPLPERFRLPEYLVQGCQSSVWMSAWLDDAGCIALAADSDSVIVKGILAVLSDLFIGAPATSVRGFKFTFLEDTGLDTLFSPQRKNGIAALLSRIRETALAQDAQPQG